MLTKVNILYRVQAKVELIEIIMQSNPSVNTSVALKATDTSSVSGEAAATFPKGEGKPDEALRDNMLRPYT